MGLASLQPLHPRRRVRGRLVTQLTGGVGALGTGRDAGGEGQSVGVDSAHPNLCQETWFAGEIPEVFPRTLEGF